MDLEELEKLWLKFDRYSLVMNNLRNELLKNQKKLVQARNQFQGAWNEYKEENDIEEDFQEHFRKETGKELGDL